MFNAKKTKSIEYRPHGVPRHFRTNFVMGGQGINYVEQSAF